MRLAVRKTDTARRMTPAIPNSSPRNGINRINAPVPIHVKKTVTRREPHAAHPTPSVPLTTPMNPVANPLLLTLAILRPRKKTTSATFTPKRTAIITTYKADNVEKFVNTDPSKAIGKEILSETDPLEKSTCATSLILGNHIAKTKTVKLEMTPMNA